MAREGRHPLAPLRGSDSASIQCALVPRDDLSTGSAGWRETASERTSSLNIAALTLSHTIRSLRNVPNLTLRPRDIADLWSPWPIRPWLAHRWPSHHDMYKFHTSPPPRHKCEKTLKFDHVQPHAGPHGTARLPRVRSWTGHPWWGCRPTEVSSAVALAARWCAATTK